MEEEENLTQVSPLARKQEQGLLVQLRAVLWEVEMVVEVVLQQLLMLMELVEEEPEVQQALQQEEEEEARR